MDFFYTHNGSVCSLCPESQVAKNWCHDFIGDEAFRIGDAFVMLRKDLESLLEAIEADGMTGNWL